MIISACSDDSDLPLPVARLSAGLTAFILNARQSLQTPGGAKREVNPDK
jgi:hypothetical protein